MVQFKLIYNGITNICMNFFYQFPLVVGPIILEHTFITVAGIRVNAALLLIAATFSLFTTTHFKGIAQTKKVSPRTHCQDYNIPTFHGMTKMQHFIILYGCSINLYGGPGKYHHKYFSTPPGDNTHYFILGFQRR